MEGKFFIKVKAPRSIKISNSSYLQAIFRGGIFLLLTNENDALSKKTKKLDDS